MDFDRQKIGQELLFFATQALKLCPTCLFIQKQQLPQPDCKILNLLLRDRRSKPLGNLACNRAGIPAAIKPFEYRRLDCSESVKLSPNRILDYDE
jgi:hypothetical protein